MSGLVSHLYSQKEDNGVSQFSVYSERQHLTNTTLEILKADQSYELVYRYILV